MNPSNQPSVTQRITELVASQSVSCTCPDIDQGNIGTINLLANWLDDLGFDCQIQHLEQPDKANLIARRGPAGTNHRDSQRGGGLVLAGHADTVPFDDQLWHSDPFKVTERDGKLHGLGTCDMKGFLAIATDVAARTAAAKFDEPLYIIATADEETGMDGARALMKTEGISARRAVIGEPTGLAPVRMHKGMMMLAIRVDGKSGHSSDPGLGVNALEVMYQVIGELLAFRAELSSKHINPAFAVQVPTMNLGCIHGGDNPNRICGHTELQIDLRLLPGMCGETILADLRKRLAPVGAQHGVRLSLATLFPPVPPFETKADSEFVRTIETATRQQAGTVAFGTEGPFLQAMGMDTIILGPGDIDQAHQPDEFLRLDSINPTIRLLGDLVAHYCVAA